MHVLECRHCGFGPFRIGRVEKTLIRSEVEFVDLFESLFGTFRRHAVSKSHHLRVDLSSELIRHAGFVTFFAVQPEAVVSASPKLALETHQGLREESPPFVCIGSVAGRVRQVDRAAQRPDPKAGEIRRDSLERPNIIGVGHVGVFVRQAVAIGVHAFKETHRFHNDRIIGIKKLLVSKP